MDIPFDLLICFKSLILEAFQTKSRNVTQTHMCNIVCQTNRNLLTMVTKAQNLLIRIPVPKDLIKIECNTTTLALLLLPYDSTHSVFFMNIRERRFSKHENDWIS